MSQYSSVERAGDGRRGEVAALIERVIAFLDRTALENQGWLVGGYVRDRLLGRSSRDLDIIVPQEAIRLARAVADAFGGAFFILDNEREVARAVLSGADGVPVEVDVAVLRAPELRDDLRLRDFTVNAMAAESGRSLKELRVIDPFDGRGDIALSTLRVVTRDAFRDDPLRMMRAVRLAGELGFRIDSHTFRLIQRDAALIEEVAAERVCDELYRIVAAPGGWQQLRLLARTRLLGHVLPEAAALIGVEQTPPHYQDVFDHSRSVMAHLEGIFALVWPEGPYGRPEQVAGDPTIICDAGMWDEVAAMLAPYRDGLRAHLTLPLASGHLRREGLLWSALTHDWGKPAMRSLEPDGVVRFLNHDNWGALVAQNRAQALKLSGDEAAYLALLTGLHMRPAYLAHDYPASPRAVYRFFRDAQGAGPDCVLLSLADHMATRAPDPDAEHWQRRLGTARLLLESFFNQRAERVEPRPFFDGHRIMAEFGLRPGPQVGELIEGLREAQAAGEVTSASEALAWLTERVRPEP